MMRPLLSICIPTYNRDQLLRLQLISLGEQVRELGDAVEIIVSDNCSSDDTRQVVEAAQQHTAIRYHRNSDNIGFLRNFLLVNELATGEFCWLLGDDDMVVKGKISKLLRKIGANPNLDYFLLNYFQKNVEQRNYLIEERGSDFAAEPDECASRDFSERYVAEWQDLLTLSGPDPAGIFTAIVCHVFRRSAWLACAPALRIQDEPYSSLDSTFPHIKILAHAMYGKPAYYIGDPCVLLGIGGQEWSRHWWVSYVVHLNSAIGLYEQLGVDAGIIRSLRAHHLRISVPFVPDLLLNSKVPGRGYFSLREFVLQNRHYPVSLGRLFCYIVRTWVVLDILRPLQKVFCRLLPSQVYRILDTGTKRVLQALKFI